MTYILDTDILTLYERGHPIVALNVTSHPLVEIATTIITVEEQWTGRMASIRRARRADQVAEGYRRLTETIAFLRSVPLITYSQRAIARFQSLVTQRLNIGKTDLRIAAIALEAGAAVVTRNTRDFSRVPGLTVEDWSI